MKYLMLLFEATYFEFPISSPPEVSLGKSVLKTSRRTLMPKCDYNKVALQLLERDVSCNYG